MSNVDGNKEVFFDVYCPQCEYKECEEDDFTKPCYDCLDMPVNQNSHKPVNFKLKNSQK